MKYNVQKIAEDIRKIGDLIPDEYDGSYELERSIIKEYQKLNSLSSVTYLDLNAVYGMVIGTWKLSIEKKKEYVQKTSLPDDCKELLFNVLDKVWDNACYGKYKHDTKAFAEENHDDLGSDYRKPIVGMFGTGFYSFSETPQSDVERFINMCIDIAELDKDEEIFDYAEMYLENGIIGMQAASVSMILHCLKPYTFPIINGNFTGETIYPILGVELLNQKSEKTYIENCRRIKKYRDQNFGRVNYRVFDLVSLKVNDYVIEDDEPEKPDDGFWPSQEEYPVNLTKEDWKRYITEVELPDHVETMKMLKAMMELGGQASCKELSGKCGGNPTKYVGLAVNLGKRAKKYFGLPACIDVDQERYFPIPFQGKRGAEDGNNNYVYRIRDELKNALAELDLSGIDPHFKAEPESPENVRYWLYAPGERARMWDACVENGVMLLGWSGIGDLQEYNTRKEMIEAMREEYGEGSYWMDSLATWEFSHVIKPGDIIFAKKGRSKLVGRGKVVSGYFYDPKYGEYPNVMGVDWKDVGEWIHPGLAQVKTLTDVTNNTEYVNKLNELFNEAREEHEKYDDNRFLDEVFIPREKLQELKDLLEHKQNIILQGAPGVGKTFAAKRLAYTLMGEKNNARIEFIQFHQNYSYEDFIMGFKPNENGGFEMQEGVFYNFCESARKNKDQTYFFIIDEINRGNLSKIFGELLMAIEADYKDKEVRLAYRDEYFSVPGNLRIIGMMNTADRSLAMIDYALRRRFSFVSMEPGFDSAGFRKYQNSLNNEMFNKLINAVIALNEDISKDESLGSGFCIGHSYFCNLKPETCTKRRLQEIVKYDLIPTLEEYWFDNKNELDQQKQALWDVVK